MNIIPKEISRNSCLTCLTFHTAQTPRVGGGLPFPPLCPGTAENQATQGPGATQRKLQPRAAVQNKMKSWITN